MDNQELETYVKELTNKVNKLEKSLASLFGHVSKLSEIVGDSPKALLNNTTEK